MDVKTAFLNGDLKENVFMSQSEGFVVKGKEQKACKLVKSLYGLKQAPRSWYEKLTEHLLKLNFEHFDLDDATLFTKQILHDRMQPYLYSNGTKNEAHIKRRKRI